MSPSSELLFERLVRLPDGVALHARPAGTLVRAAAAFASENPQLKQVQAVYILPMGSGMDQYLANKITRLALFQVVTDPQKGVNCLFIAGAALPGRRGRRTISGRPAWFQ